MPEGVEQAMGEDVRQFTVHTSDADYPLHASAAFVGADLLVCIWGGERPHIGAVAAAQPRPSLADASARSATASVITFLGHKEDGVVKSVGEALAAALDTNVVVTAGIHWDDISPEGIAAVNKGCRELIGLIEVGAREAVA
jgi:hypothetical protein